MGYQLYGSKTSPFVRRIRVLLENIPFDFKEMNIFETQDALELNRINPINQIPVLVDGENTIWDSRMIFNYLNTIHRFQNMDWQDENLLTAIDGAIGAGVSLLMMKRSGIPLDGSLMYVGRHQDRIESILNYLAPYLKEKELKEWNFHTISLYCFLDWAHFRDIISLDHRPEYQHFLQQHQPKSILTLTEIPKV